MTLVADTELALVAPDEFAPHWPAADVDMHQVLEQLRHVDGLADRADLLFTLHTHTRVRYGPDAASVLWWLASLEVGDPSLQLVDVGGSAEPGTPARRARRATRNFR